MVINRLATSIVLLWALGVPARTRAQVSPSSIITTFAGAAWKFESDGDPALDAPISEVTFLSTDLNGAILFADTGNHMVSRLNPDGTISVLAGNGVDGFSGNGGQATEAALNRPSSVVMDASGALFIYDSQNLRIRRVSPDGVITNYAGTGIQGSTGNNVPATQATLQYGGRLAIDHAGNLYITDGPGAIVRRIAPNGVISTFAGNGKNAHAGENVPATQASIALGNGHIACDAAGNLYIVETNTSQIRKVTSAGVITTVAGAGGQGYKDGPAAAAQFKAPIGITVDPGGALYVSDQGNGVVRKISAGVVSTVAGVQGSFGFAGDGGPALKAQFEIPVGLAIDGKGNLIISDTGNLRLRSVGPAGNIRTVAGNAEYRDTPDGAAAEDAYLFGPLQISFDANGALLIADTSNFRIRRVNPDGTIQNVAGTGAQGSGFEGGPATKALLASPRGVVADAKGNIYISDLAASVVYIVGTDGNINVFAGQKSVAGYSGDGGPPTKATLTQPVGMALDAAGNLYIADSGNNRIRKITANGATISTYPNAAAVFLNPLALAFDRQGNLLVADNDGNRIRKITPAGVISTIAGDGTPASTGNGGPAISASIFQPNAIAVDALGNIYINEQDSRVRRISPNGVISAFAGSGRAPFDGDGGPANQASFGGAGLAIDAAGNVYISDTRNDRIRVVLARQPSVSVSTTGLSFTASSGGDLTEPQPIAVSSSLEGLLLTAKSDSPWLKVPAGVASAPQNVQVLVDPSKLAPGTYQGNVTLQSPGSTVPLATIPVTVKVGAAVPPALTVQAPVLTFSFLDGAAPDFKFLQVLNTGGGTLNYQAAVTGAASGGVTLSALRGAVTPGSPARIRVTVDPSQLPDGTSSGRIAITASNGERSFLPVTITIVPLQPRVTLSQRGFLFTAVKGGGVTPAQSFAVLNTGNAKFNWTGSAIPLLGQGWLKVSPGGSSTPAAFSSATVSVDPSGLDAGVYYGLARIASDGTTNSPQDAEVVLNLLTPDFDPGAVVGPSGLVFTAVAGDSAPGSQQFQITNLSPTPALFAARPIPLGGPWLRALPSGGTLRPGASQTITVQANVGDLKPGVYNGSVAIQAGSVPRAVNVLLVVAPGAGAASGGAGASPGCTPTTLHPIITSFVQDFTIPANWPIPVEVRAVDDCGAPMTAGRVVASFSNGDPPLDLAPLGDGRWQGTWFGRSVRASQMVITASADIDSPQISGRFSYTGTLQVNTSVPVVNAGGVTIGAVAAPQAPLSPGSVISISGTNLSVGTNSAQQPPLGTDLSGTEVLLAGRSLPLLYASGGLINAVVPYDIGVNAQYQVIVSNAGAISGPETVTMAAAQPSIFKIDTTGSTQVAQDVWNRVTSGPTVDAAFAAPGSPIQAGTKLVIYCTGLGVVDQAVDPTQPAPDGTVNASNPVSVSIGGRAVTPSFAGLASGFPGIYQINVTVPAGVAAGTAVPVVVSVAGQASAPVNVPAR